MQVLKHFLCYSSQKCLGYSTKLLTQSSFRNCHLIPLVVHDRKYSDDLNILSPPLNVKFAFNVNFDMKSKELEQHPEQRRGNRDVYLVEDHYNFSHAVKRKPIVDQLSKTIQDMNSSKTRVVYMYGLPGIGKKALVRQFALQHYENLQRTGEQKKFVAMINASDPNSFHHDLFKIAEQADVIENYDEYLNRTSKPKGYVDILSSISSRLKDRSNWLLVLKDIKLDKNLRWLVGEILPENVDLVKKIQTVDLHSILPNPNDPSNGTILLTTCDSYARRHCTTNVKHFNMPNGMEDNEALELLENVSGCKPLQKCEPALKVIQELTNVPTSVYW